MEQVLEAIIKETSASQKYAALHENASKALRKYQSDISVFYNSYF